MSDTGFEAMSDTMFTGDHAPDVDGQVFDVAVVGAGVVGAAVARELSGFELSVALLEGRGDVGDATSKANTAILHTGFDARPGTLESALVRRGYELLSRYAAATGIPVERTGAVLAAWTPEELEALPGLREKAARNGYDRCEIIDAGAVYGLVPSLGPGVLGGLTVPDEAIICPWTTTLAYATEAVSRGTRLLLNRQVTGVIRGGPEPDGGDEGDRVSDNRDSGERGVTVLQTADGPIRARWVVNAAGLGADVVDGWFGYDRFTVTPRRGELIVFDKLARPLVDRIVLPVPTARGKGVLVSPTVYGNVMLGPTSEDLRDRADTSTSESGLEALLGKGRALVPRLLDEEVTATYAGLRAAVDHNDYVIGLDLEQRYVCLGGIRSTGLSASLAIAEHVHDLLAKAGLELRPWAAPPSPPRMPSLGEAFPRPYQRADLIARDHEYGRVVCFCERVTRGEIRDAFTSPIPPFDLDGLRRRTRALMGRCQGFYCGAEVERLLAEHTTPDPTTTDPAARATDADPMARAGRAARAADAEPTDATVDAPPAKTAGDAARADPADPKARADPAARRPHESDQTHKPSQNDPRLSATRPRRRP